MTTPEEESRLREQFVANRGSESEFEFSQDRAIRKVVRAANVETGTRDLVVLAVASFFSFLQLLMAPFVTRISSHNASLPAPGQPQNDKHEG